jgi:hypothetical protein
MKIKLVWGLLICAVSGPGMASPLPVKGRFIYSNACESDGGDFGNFRVTIARNHGDMKAIVEFNDEGPDGRAPARDLKFNPVTGDLRFSYLGSVDSAHHAFSGKISREKLQGYFDDDAATLPAIRRLPKELPPCR